MEFSGRPGTSLMCNEERIFPMTLQEKEEILRNERFQRIFDTLKNIECDIPLLTSSNNERAARSGQNFFNGGKGNQGKRDDHKDGNLTNALNQYIYTTQASWIN